MLGRSGVFGQGRSFRADRPIPAGSPPPGAYATATLGAERNLTPLFQAAYPSVVNFYQCNFRVDPAAPSLRQSVSFKTGSNENRMGYLWTTDGWATSNAYLTTTDSGDPDTIWTNAGDLLLGCLGANSNDPYKIRRVVGGGATVGAPINASATGIDFAHLFADRPSGRIYLAGTNHARNGVSLSFSDDGGFTWTKRNKSFTTAINNGFTSQGCQTDAGTILLPQTEKTTILSVNGAYTGTNQNCHVLRSVDQGVTYATIFAFDMNRAGASAPGGVIHAHNMVFHGGRVHWLKAKQTGGNNSPVALYYGFSVDDGLTFSWNTTPIPIPFSGAGSSQAWIGVIPGAIVVYAVYLALNYSFQMWAHYSFDGGATWASRQVTPGTINSTAFNVTPRVPGDDQNDCDIVGNTAWLVWPDHRDNAGTYKTYTRSLTFS